MTIASDAPSEIQRRRMAKALKEQHLIDAALLARKHQIHRLKIYSIIGLPHETEEDMNELVRFSLELSKIHKLTLAVNPLVPKLRTPMATAQFGPIRELEKKVSFLKKSLRGRVTLRALSPRWAWVEAMLSLGGPDMGRAVLEIARGNDSYQDWKRALSGVTHSDEAIAIAKRHGLERVLPQR